MSENLKEKSVSMIINPDIIHGNNKIILHNHYNLKSFNSLDNSKPTKIHNLPELKLIKIKSKPEYNPETNINNLKQYYKIKINKQKSISMKRNNQNVIFPKIRIKNDDDNNNNINSPVNNSLENSMNDDNKNYILHNPNNNIKIINNKNSSKRKSKNVINISMKLGNGTKNIHKLLLQPLQKNNNNNNTSLFNNQIINSSSKNTDKYQNLISKKNLLTKELKDLDVMTEKLNQINKEQDIIIVAQTMGPADLMDYDYKKIRGLILEEGTPTMHVAIVAKALNIPVVAKINGIFKDVKDGELLGINGEEGFVYINPPDDIVQKFKSKQKNMTLLLEQLKQLRRFSSKTLDGIRISLNINVGLDFDFDYIDSTKCDGIGL